MGLLEQVGLVLLDQVDRARGVARGQRVVDGLVEVAVFDEPLRRDPVELFDPLGMVTVESAAQEFGEHVVVAKPVRILVASL